MYYCSAFAPFTQFQKAHIQALVKQEPSLILLFLNTSMNDIKTKLYFQAINNELSLSLSYRQIDDVTLMAMLEEGENVYFDQLVIERATQFSPLVSKEKIMEIEQVYGYECQSFQDNFIFDDISSTMAQYLIKNELFDITRNIGLVYNNMSYERFQHTMRVRYLIKKLAILHQLDLETAQFTALFHDYAKEIPSEEQYAIVERYFPQYTDTPAAVWHGFAGAVLLEQLYGTDITNDDIYEAIEFHPIGIPHYSELGLALFIADFCDYRRPFTTETNHVWQLAQTSLYQAAAAKIESIQKHFAKTGKTMYWTTQNMLEWLKEEKI